MRAIGILLAATLATGCWVDIDAEIRSSCTTRHDVMIEPMPAADAHGVIDVEFDLALDELDWLEDVDAELRFTHVRARPTSGVTSLAFIDAARVTIASADPAAALPTLTVVECSAGSCPRAGELLLPSELQTDAIAYATAGSLVVTATIAGELPTVPWTIDVEVCAEGGAFTTR